MLLSNAIGVIATYDMQDKPGARGRKVKKVHMNVMLLMKWGRRSELSETVQLLVYEHRVLRWIGTANRICEMNMGAYRDAAKRHSENKCYSVHGRP